MSKGLTKRSEDYSKWYNELVAKADLAENSEVRGCMIIKPYGYAIWENIQQNLDKMLKETGHQNMYFPTLIPKSFLSKEADHVDGFAKECAVVTHYRLRSSEDGGVEVDPNAKLEEEMILRPTSETTIWNTYRGWIQSYRDLPLLYNQWANVFRWEMRTRIFLRTSEFLWQEGHTAHATADEALAETKKVLGLYTKLTEDLMAIPMIQGIKTENERFAGAEETFCIEALMQDNKALQAGTSHFLGQNFAKAFDVQYTSKEGKLEHVWASSWGVSTRLMGALIMSHSDDQGLVLPPNIAPDQVVIVPIYKGDDQLAEISEHAEKLMTELRAKGIRVKFDDRDTHRPGWKFAEYEMKGVPVRLAIGMRDLEKGLMEIARRDTGEKESVEVANVVSRVGALITEIQKNLFNKAKKHQEDNTHSVDTFDEFKKIIKKDGGFVHAHWDGTVETEKKIKELTGATIRCIPLDSKEEAGGCILTGNPSKQKVLFAKAY
jgi:prolyl-tRNA synthetase